jgi:hypothetical protein
MSNLSNINITKLTRTIDDYNEKLYDDIAKNIQIKMLIIEKTIFGEQWRPPPSGILIIDII